MPISTISHSTILVIKGCMGNKVVFEAREGLFASERLEAASWRLGGAENVKEMIKKIMKK